MITATTPEAGGHTRDDDDDRWAAVLRRDGGAPFFYSVRTTGVYCRPSCGARRPRRDHVRFHATGAEAEQEGFRPCRRCRPDADPPALRRSAVVADACRAMEEAEEMPGLGALASRAGMSPSHFHRVFKAETGVTPKHYATAVRRRRVHSRLPEAASVTEAIYDAGFSSSGRFYAAADDMLGMRPSDVRAGGRGLRIRYAVGRCSLGSVLVAASDRGLCAILLGDEPAVLLDDLRYRFPEAELVAGDEGFDRCTQEVVRFVDEPRLGLALPLDVRGTAFQQRVWRALGEIPTGSTASYSDIARRIGAPRAARAVAQACAANPLAVAIPCHRVVRGDGSLSGYRWGVERKRALLTRETTR